LSITSALRLHFSSTFQFILGHILSTRHTQATQQVHWNATEHAVSKLMWVFQLNTYSLLSTFKKAELRSNV